MISIIILCCFALSATITLYFLPKILLLSLKNRILDKIDSRKVHSSAASRLGGASFLPAIVISTVLGAILIAYFHGKGYTPPMHTGYLIIIISAMTLYFVGIYDDIVGMRYKEKFVFQFITAAMVVASGNYICDFNGILGINAISPYIGIPLTMVLIVFITNSINLIDGIDGLASSLSMVAFLAYGVMFFISKDYINALFCITSLGALLPFWHHNIWGVRKGIRSKIFMGDGGALVIGFILSTMAISLWNNSTLEGAQNNYISEFSWMIAFTMLIIPCFDVIRVVLHRAKSHKPLFLPDKTHFHHKLMELGFSARHSLFILIIFNASFLSVNCILAAAHLEIAAIVLADVALWVLIHIIISRRISSLRS